MSSVGALHTGRIFAEANRLFFALFATSPRIGKLGPTVFQSVGDDLAQGRILASFACRQHAKRVVVLANRSDTYSDGLAREFSNQLRSLKECPLDGDIRQHDYVAGRFDLASFLRLVKEAKADLVFVPDLQVIAAQIVRALRIEKLDDVRVIGGDGWEAGSDSHDIFFKDFPKVAKQLPYYYTIHWHPEIGTAENVRIRALVEQKTGRAPTGLAVLTWEVLSQVVKTVQEAGTADNLALTGKLRGRTYEGVTGKVTFGRDGRTLRDMVLIRLTPEGPKVEEVVPTPETGGK
jgi:ABC-type branched-subunit amino acid transport system substrate-binding protein